MYSIKNIFDLLISIPSNKLLSQNFKDRIVLTNKIALTLVLVAFPYIFIFQSVSTSLANSVIPIVIIFLCVIFLNKINRNESEVFPTRI